MPDPFPHDIPVSSEPVTDTARRHLGDGHRPTVAIARAMLEHMGAEHGTIGVRVALDVAAQLDINLRVLLIEADLALLVEDAPGTWSGLIPDYSGIAWVPMPASALLAMDAELLCAHDAAARLAS